MKWMLVGWAILTTCLGILKTGAEGAVYICATPILLGIATILHKQDEDE